MSKYDVAAYIWPAYTGDEPRSKIFWEEGMGEWQTVKNALSNQKSKQNSSRWDRKPLWGYVNEADPYVMQMQIDAAADHGVNVFIYDWYWYDDRPFLEQCLNNGFLKAANNERMKFYIMWANHDANYTWDIRNSGREDSTIWSGKVTDSQFRKIGKRWLEKYFVRNNYYKIAGKPVLSIYDLSNFIAGLGGVEKSTEAMKWLDSEAKKAGLSGVHFQFIKWGDNTVNLSGVDGGVKDTDAGLIERMGFESLTHYQFVHYTNIDRDYSEILPDMLLEWEKIGKEYSVEYFPHVSVGWDNNPRFRDFRPGIVKNNTPEAFEKALRYAKAFADKNNTRMVTINSWNEWTETSYLEPDNLYGYAYLEAVKHVFVE